MGHHGFRVIPAFATACKRGADGMHSRRTRMRIDATILPKDLAGALRLHRRLEFGARFAFVVIPAVWAACTLWKLWDMRQMALLYSGIALVGVIVAGFFVERRLALRKLRQRIDLGRERSVTIGENGIVFVTARGRKSHPWLCFAEYKRGRNMVLMYLADGDYLIFPRRWFTPEQWEEFRTYLTAEIGVLGR